MRSADFRKIITPVSVSRHACPQRQQGVVLFITLIVLIAMTLAALALMRSVDTGNVVAGNMAFKQGATLAGDSGTAAAITELTKIAGKSESYIDIPTQGYYATNLSSVDMTGNGNDPARPGRVDWEFNGCDGTAPCIRPCCSGNAPAIAANNDPASPGFNAGNEVTYIIDRLCRSTGSPASTSNNCADFQSAAGSNKIQKGGLQYGSNLRFAGTPMEYYRITSRVKGPRNTITYIETIVHF